MPDKDGTVFHISGLRLPVSGHVLDGLLFREDVIVVLVLGATAGRADAVIITSRVCLGGTTVAGASVAHAGT